MHSTIADLNIGLGSSFQIMPSGRLPLRNKRFGGKFALINLQPIRKLEKSTDLVIHSYVDEVMVKVLKRLGIEDIPEHDGQLDPTKSQDRSPWNFDPAHLKEVEKVYKEKVGRKKKTAETEDDCKVDKKKRKIEGCKPANE